MRDGLIDFCVSDLSLATRHHRLAAFDRHFFEQVISACEFLSHKVYIANATDKAAIERAVEVVIAAESLVIAVAGEADEPRPCKTELRLVRVEKCHALAAWIVTLAATTSG